MFTCGSKNNWIITSHVTEIDIILAYKKKAAIDGG